MTNDKTGLDFRATNSYAQFFQKGCIDQKQP